MKKWKASVIILAGVFLVAWCGVLQWRWTYEAPLSHKYKQIQVGMTKHQVEMVLGPPRWEVKKKNPRWIDPEDMGSFLQFGPSEWWVTEGVIQIWYFDGRVSQKDFTKHRCKVEPLTLVDKLPFIKQWLP